MVSQEIPFCPELFSLFCGLPKEFVLSAPAAVSSGTLCFLCLCYFHQPRLSLFPFCPHSFYSFPPPIDIRTLAFKYQLCCSFSSLIFTILLVHLGLWMLCLPFFIPFIAALLLLPSLSSSTILSCSLSQILLLPSIPLPRKCHICLWLLMGTSSFILLPVLNMREDISQGCVATSLRSNSCMQFRFCFAFSLNIWIFRRGQFLPLWVRDLQPVQGLVLWSTTRLPIAGPSLADLCAFLSSKTVLSDAQWALYINCYLYIFLTCFYSLGVWRLVSYAERKYVASLVSPQSLLNVTAFCGGQRVATHRYCPWWDVELGISKRRRLCKDRKYSIL